jgi:hypothetical protein
MRAAMLTVPAACDASARAFDQVSSHGPICPVTCNWDDAERTAAQTLHVFHASICNAHAVYALQVAA